MKNQWQEKVLRHAGRLIAAVAASVKRVPRISRNRIQSILKRNNAGGLLPFELVKYFAFTALLAMLMASLVLAWMVSNNARTVLLKRSEASFPAFCRQSQPSGVSPVCVAHRCPLRPHRPGAIKPSMHALTVLS